MAQGRNAISRQIIKAMSVFGGVQVLTILCSIVRTKLVAVWIGPVGIGLFGIYNSAIDMINTIANLGIRSSSVRDISIEVEHGNHRRIAEIIGVVRRWTWALGAMAALLMLAAAPLLSRWTFGDDNHSLGFVALSVAVMLTAIVNCEQSILQGTRQLRRLAQVGVYSAAVGLVVSVPLFYFMRAQSIVLSIIAYVAAAAFFAWKFRNKDYADITVRLTASQVVSRGAGFVRLGIFMTLGTFLSMLSSYIFIAYLNHASGTAAVGHYQAGYTLIHRYAGLIFTAIGTEYYPRLASVCQSRWRTRLFVSQEINITLTVLAAIVAVFILSRQLVVNILYSADFNAIIPFITYASIGIVFQAISWCMAYVIIARGKGKIYILTEIASTAIGLALNITFYNIAGLTGLGWAYAVWYAIYTIIVGVVYFRVFRLTLHRSTLIVALYATTVAVAAIITMNTGLWPLTAAIAVVATIAGCAMLRKRLRR